VAVENLEPAASKRKPKLITVISRLAEACDHEDVTAFSLDPAMESDHARRIMTVKHVDASAPERSKSAPERDQFARKAEMIAHCPIAAETVPPDPVIRVIGRIVPDLVLKKLLSHEQHGNA